jgi:hypothetical protein
MASLEGRRDIVCGWPRQALFRCDTAVLVEVRWWEVCAAGWTVGRCNWSKVRIGSERDATCFTLVDVECDALLGSAG